MKLDETQALGIFAALSQATRLQMVRDLVVAGPSGLPAGAIAEKVDTSSSGASFHLSQLEQAGLVTSQREGRSIIYSANYEALSGVIEFLMRDCCQGHPDVVAGASAAAAACCPPLGKAC